MSDNKIDYSNVTKPYVLIKGDNSIDVDIDLMVLDDRNIILCSAVDIPVKIKKLNADLYLQKSSLYLKDRIDNDFKVDLFLWNESYKYTTEKDENNLHSMIYNKKINDYIINWDGEDKATVITRYLRNKKYLPVIQEIVQMILDKDEEENKKYTYGDYSICKSMQVVTNNPLYEKLEVYKLNDYWFKEKILNLNILQENDGFDWGKIETIEDYLFTFLDPIKNKLKNNVSVLFDEDNINVNIFKLKRKPYLGQVPIIQSSIEVLKNNIDDRFVYLTAQPGFGKTECSIAINHIYYQQKNKKNYITMIVCPTTTISQWQQELKDVINDDIDVKVIKKTKDFIQWYNKTKMQVDKPTYIIVGKETFKLSYKKRAGINIKKTLVNYRKKETVGYHYTHTEVRDKSEILEVVTCPDCGAVLKNPLITSEDRLFTEDDFKGNPKKSNYKCTQCGSVLWQGTYDKTMKTSVIDFIKRKNVQFDSILVDEAHESSNQNSIIGNATRTLFNYSKKILCLSGTSNNGYASSLYNILFGLIPRKLQKNEIEDIQKFIKTYGTLKAVNKRKDGEYYSRGRSQIKDSDYKEIEGINPIVFTSYLCSNYINATLDDLTKDYPKIKNKIIEFYKQGLLNQNDILSMCNIKDKSTIKNTYSDSELINLLNTSIKTLPSKRDIYEPIELTWKDNLLNCANRLENDIKSADSFNAQMYNSTILLHYMNNPFNWDSLTITTEKNGDRVIQPINLDEDIILKKEEKLIEIVKQELSEGRKIWIYTDFTHGGEYMKGDCIPKRLQKLLKDNDIDSYWLKHTVKAIDRIDVIKQNKDKFNVFISHPKLVAVGLNMVFCPTYIFLTPSYNVNTVEQASLRGYRSNATLENRIYHLYYNTGIEKKMEEKYQLKKAEQAAIEGKFDVNIRVKRTASSLGKKISDSIENNNKKVI